jgi:hypothetical protein
MRHDRCPLFRVDLIVIRNDIVVVVSIAPDKRRIMIYKVTKGATFQ